MMTMMQLKTQLWKIKKGRWRLKTKKRKWKQDKKTLKKELWGREVTEGGRNGRKAERRKGTNRVVTDGRKVFDPTGRHAHAFQSVFISPLQTRAHPFLFTPGHAEQQREARP